jgi:antirestriction protein ArdC
MSKVEEKRNEFVERVVKSLEDGVVPWRGMTLPAAPQQNAASGRNYSGINALYLLETASANGYSDPRWLTHKDAETHGLKVRAGEKSVGLEYWGKDEEGKAAARSYPVFNIQQFYGTEAGAKGTEEYQKPDYAKAVEVLKKTGMEPPSEDKKEAYQEAVKSLLASTAEKSEVLKNIQSPQLKELRMNMAGAFLAQEAGIPLGAPGETPAPATEWAKTLRLNPKELFRAARDAVKLTNEALGRTKNQEQAAELSKAELPKAELSQTEQTRQEQTQPDLAREQREQEKIFEPEVGQRVTFQPHDGKTKLTGTVKEVSETEVVLQCGRVTIPALREKGTFSEAPEPDRTHTKEYAKEQAQKHAGENGNVYTARGEDAVYKGAVVELTPTFAIQKVGEDAILHRLKDLEKADGEKSPIQAGQDVSIVKGAKGVVTVEPWDREQGAQAREQRQEHEGIAR